MSHRDPCSNVQSEFGTGCYRSGDIFFLYCTPYSNQLLNERCNGNGNGNVSPDSGCQRRCEREGNECRRECDRIERDCRRECSNVSPDRGCCRCRCWPCRCNCRNNVLNTNSVSDSGNFFY